MLTTYLFYAIFLIYGVWGTPTPEHIGYAEVSLGTILVFLSLPRLINLLKQFNLSETGTIALPALLITGLVLAAINGHSTTLISRDIIALLFVFLPFLLVLHNAALETLLTRGACFIGLAFSLRFIAGLDLTGLMNGTAFSDPHFSYLANSPLVLFSALYLLYKAAQTYQNTANPLTILSQLFLSLAPITAMLLMQQRASMIAVAFYVFILLIWTIYQTPGRGLLLSVFLFSSLYFLTPALEPIYNLFYQKTLLSGMNMRFEEWYAVLDVIRHDWIFALFGQGWGASFISPAVGNVPIGFTHNIFSMYLLKTGFIGLGLIGLYLFSLIKNQHKQITVAPILFSSALIPFFIAITLYANFKSFGFGIILLLIAYGFEKQQKVTTKIYPVYQSDLSR